MPRVLGATTVLGGATALGFGVASAQAQFDARDDVDGAARVADEAEARGLAAPGSMQEPADGLRAASEQWGRSGLSLAISGGIAVLGGVTALATRGRPAVVANTVAGAAALAAGVSGIKVAIDSKSVTRHAEEVSAANRSLSASQAAAPDTDAARDQDVEPSRPEAASSDPRIEDFALQLDQADEATMSSDERAVRRAVLEEATGRPIPTGAAMEWHDVADALDTSADGTLDAAERTPSDEADALGTYAAYREEAIETGRDPARTMPLVVDAMFAAGGRLERMVRTLEDIAAEGQSGRPAAMDDLVGALDARLDALLGSSQAAAGG